MSPICTMWYSMYVCNTALVVEYYSLSYGTYTSNPPQHWLPDTVHNHLSAPPAPHASDPRFSSCEIDSPPQRCSPFPSPCRRPTFSIRPTSSPLLLPLPTRGLLRHQFFDSFANHVSAIEKTPDLASLLRRPQPADQNARTYPLRRQGSGCLWAL